MREVEENERRAQFEQQQKKDEAIRKKNELYEQLNKEMQFRVREVLNELSQRGIKKVGKDRIVDLERREEDLDYDTIMTFYQNVLRREQEAFEVSKNKKVNDVEIWTRALREEECIEMQKYCKEKGNQEMENIEKAIRAKHTKELLTKKALENALPAYNLYKQALIERRKKIHSDQQKIFANQQGELAKAEMLDHAKK